MRNGDELAALRALPVHPIPQIFGVWTIERREELLRRVASENHIAVQVRRPEFRDLRHGRELISCECREGAGIIIAFRRCNGFRPHTIDIVEVVNVFDGVPINDGSTNA